MRNQTNQMQTQIDLLVKKFMVQLTNAVAESLGDTASEVSSPKAPPVRVGKVSHPPDSVQMKRPEKGNGRSAKRNPLKEGARLVIITALRKGESCEMLASKYNLSVRSVAAIKANLTRGAYD